MAKEPGRIARELRGKRLPFTEIPVVDFAPFLSGDPAGKAETAAAIRHACLHAGFFYLKNHGVAAADRDGIFRTAQDFFALPDAVKATASVTQSRHNRGYIEMERENLDPTRQKVGDLKEGFNMGRHVGEADPDHGKPLRGPNLWPDGADDFRTGMERYWQVILGLAGHLQHAFALALDIEETFFDDKLDRSLSTLRLLHYPPQTGDITQDQIGAGAHTDYGMFTLLLQDDAGGLQVRNVAGDWIEAPPIPDTFVVNIGDTLMRWTNDVFVSNPHRVINAGGGDRYSIPFFHDPNYDADISAIESCVLPGETPKYPPTTGGAYLEGRLNATYAYRQDPAAE